MTRLRLHVCLLCARGTGRVSQPRACREVRGQAERTVSEEPSVSSTPVQVVNATQALVRQLPRELRDRRVVASERWPFAARHSPRSRREGEARRGVAREGEGAQFDSDPQERGSDCKFGCRAIALHTSEKGFGLLRAHSEMGLLVGFKLCLARSNCFG